MVGKRKTIAPLAEDDTERSAKLLVKWATTSVKFRDRDLRTALDEAQEDYDKLVRILLKAYDTMPPNRKKDKDAYDAQEAGRSTGPRRTTPPRSRRSACIGKALERLSSGRRSTSS